MSSKFRNLARVAPESPTFTTAACDLDEGHELIGMTQNSTDSSSDALADNIVGDDSWRDSSTTTAGDDRVAVSSHMVTETITGSGERSNHVDMDNGVFDAPGDDGHETAVTALRTSGLSSCMSHDRSISEDSDEYQGSLDIIRCCTCLRTGLYATFSPELEN